MVKHEILICVCSECCKFASSKLFSLSWLNLKGEKSLTSVTVSHHDSVIQCHPLTKEMNSVYRVGLIHRRHVANAAVILYFHYFSSA